jgi:aspartate aminotransferase
MFLSTVLVTVPWCSLRGHSPTTEARAEMATPTLSERHLDHRLGQIPESVLHQAHRQGEDASRRGLSIFRLDVGEPAFRAPQAARNALVESLMSGNTNYSSVDGIPELRDRLVDKLRSSDGIDATPERILVTPGSSFAIATILLAVCEPGDQILLPEVFWPIYAQAAAVAQVTVSTYSLGPAYRVDPERLAAATTDRTRLVVVNSPANPTGAVCPPDALDAIAAWVRRRGIWVIGDEAYEHFVYDGGHVALAAFDRKVDPADRRVFSVHTFSKGYGMTGYRMGYAAAPNDKAARLLHRVAEATIIAPSTPVQHAAAAALGDLEAPRLAAEHVRGVRDAGLTDAVAAGLLPELPPAGWYAMVDISRTGCGSVEFSERLLREHDVLVAPGTAFVAPGACDPQRVRIAFCGDREATVEGMRRLLYLATELEGTRS